MVKWCKMVSSIKAAVFDADGVLVDRGLGAVFTSYLAEKGVLPPERWNNMMSAIRDYAAYRRTYLELSDTITENWSNGIKGMRCSLIEEHARNFMSAYDDFFPGIPEIVSMFNGRGYFTVVLSVAPVEILNELAHKLDIKLVCGTRVCSEGGVYNGRLCSSVGSTEGKAEELLNIAEENKIDLTESYAFGDTSHDVSMLSLVGHPVAVNPKEGLDTIAEERGWVVKSNTIELLKHLRGIL